ncbi:aspartic proteinase CDR1-like [Cucurbita pepo subsp. pepo]|uniref:aspartic proteinase CDR1-like n=1 Tax=Cucurbita pepo subsp. pepo TaxID=3664 RepID=UPI000C9D3FF9|nr:aspartic proteinase CDR1-like [Cucurbita pepo subsp. pepo]
MPAISIFFSLLLISVGFTTVYGGGIGFSTTLIHRDSPLSPIRNQSLSHYDRLNNAIHRSISRADALFQRAAALTGNSIESPISPGGGEYVMSVSLGTPPVPYVAIADTGSDPAWTQCMPCKKCYPQSEPVFDPKKSSSFSPVPCTSDTCKSVGGTTCGDQQSCDYSFVYGDQTYSKGELATDTITIGSTSVNMVIGCSHESGGGFGTTSGVIGLAGGDMSIVTQMSKKSSVSRKFSYCLPPVSSQGSGKINFGENAVVSGSDVVSTPLGPSTMYQITLEAISVGNERHAVGKAVAENNMIIDSGTTLSYIPKDMHDGVVSSMAKIIGSKRVNDPGNFFALCYSPDGDDLNIPSVTAHFAGGANVELPKENMFITVADGVSCLMFTAMTESDPFGIWGNIAQGNFLIGYDLEQKSLSFKPTACA